MLIQLKDNVPDIYYNQSRDFQLIGRLYDVLLNHVKLNSDIIYTVPDTSNATNNLIELLAITLGFKPRHDYNIDQLTAVCGILPVILKIKGTTAAIRLICRAILRAEGLTDTVDINISDDGSTLTILIPKLQNAMLLNDLLDYILPAGVGGNILEVGRVVEQESASFTQFGQVVDIQNTNNDLGPNTIGNRASIFTGEFDQRVDYTKTNTTHKHMFGDISSTIILGDKATGTIKPELEPTSEDTDE